VRAVGLEECACAVHTVRPVSMTDMKNYVETDVYKCKNNRTRFRDFHAIRLVIYLVLVRVYKYIYINLTTTTTTTAAKGQQPRTSANDIRINTR